MSINLKLIVGCIGAGGPSGVRGWNELFMDKELRQALVCVVIGNVLVEQREKVHCVQADHKSANGKHTYPKEYFVRTYLANWLADFLRTQEYYTAIRQFLRENDLPAAFESYAIEITTRPYPLTHRGPWSIWSVREHQDQEFRIQALITLPLCLAMIQERRLLEDSY